MTDKIAVVTGGSSGIGAAVAEELSKRGYFVAIIDINEAEGSKIAAQVDGAFVPSDVSDPVSVKATIEQVATTWGPPSLAFLNAGILTTSQPPFYEIDKVSEQEYRRMMGVNLDGVFFCLKELLPIMRGQASAITVTASAISAIPRDDFLAMDPLYTMSKHGVIGLVQAASKSDSLGGLRINSICPGAVETKIITDGLRSASVAIDQPDFMPVEVMANEVIDLMENGANGEIRVKAFANDPSYVVWP